MFYPNFLLSLRELLKTKKMLELCKEILTKVSFDRYLFQKELKKAIKWIKNQSPNTGIDSSRYI